MRPRRAKVLCLLGSFCLAPAGANAQYVEAITEFSDGISNPGGPDLITAGPDGNLWFTEQAGNRIARITPDGVVTEFSAGLSVGAGPRGIVSGPDGNLWSPAAP